jgi:hypothetical protein
VDSLVGGCFHADLRQWGKREKGAEGRHLLVHIRPGDDNVWCLLAVASHLAKLRK